MTFIQVPIIGKDASAPINSSTEIKIPYQAGRCKLKVLGICGFSLWTTGWAVPFGFKILSGVANPSIQPYVGKPQESARFGWTRKVDLLTPCVMGWIPEQGLLTSLNTKHAIEIEVEHNGSLLFQIDHPTGFNGQQWFEYIVLYLDITPITSSSSALVSKLVV